MILQALNAYYEQLAADPESGLASYGFSQQKIAFCALLNPDGTLSAIEPLMRKVGKKELPIPLTVCGNAKPSGSGLNPCFLWDNPAYMLGFKPDDPKPARTREAFEAFRQKHLGLEQQINDPEFSLVCRFLEQWNPAQASDHEALVQLGTGFGVFRVAGEQHYIHQRPAVLAWWKSQLAPPEDQSEKTKTEVTGQCLLTGITGPLARLHEPKIKGVVGAQSSGAALVSFNCDAFTSYGKDQSYNAPVSVSAAFQYSTALNRLLEDSSHRVLVGDTTAVFWTAQPCQAYELFGMIFGNQAPENDALVAKLSRELHQIAAGQYPGEIGSPDTAFYFLGLSPNAARVSIRFWYVSTLGEAIQHLTQHYQDLELIRSARDPEFIAPWQMLRETVRDSKDISPLLSGALLRAILSGQEYPELLLSSLIRRIRADREVRYLRAAAIKACLNRHARLNKHSNLKEISVSLDETRADAGYLLGRLFAELEKSQEDAMPGINATIKDRFFGAASATPATVFPRLIRLNQHHLPKIENEKFRTARSRSIQDVCSLINDFPAHLNMKHQGLFAIGYYHQRQHIFTKKSDN